MIYFTTACTVSIEYKRCERGMFYLYATLVVLAFLLWFWQKRRCVLIQMFPDERIKNPISRNAISTKSQIYSCYMYQRWPRSDVICYLLYKAWLKNLVACHDACDDNHSSCKYGIARST